MRALTHIRGQEAHTFAVLGRFIRDDVDRLTAVRAMQTIPRNTWPAAEAAPIARVLLNQIRQTSPRRRTRPDVLDEFELCEALSTLLPPAEAKSLRAQLRELGVRVVKIGTLFERMSYDQDVVAVQAGKPVEFVLQNSDLMPHNFVIAQPGSLEEVGLLSEAHAQESAFAARHYVPDSPKILAAARLMLPRETQRLSFNAPTAAGVYPFVCTYPGHWRRMYGALYVVDDLDAYLANPEAYVAKAKLEPRDSLLRDRRPRTEWTFADLAGPLAEMSHSGGRKFASGRQLFTLANCVACHRLENKGNVFGPDLTKTRPEVEAGGHPQRDSRPLGPHQRKISDEHLRVGLRQNGLWPGARRERRHNQDHRKSAGQCRADNPSARRRAGAAAIKNVADAQGALGQVDA